jgi:hypothetical protein
MNFPLLKTFDVSSSITSFLEKIFNRVGLDNIPRNNCFDQSCGYQTNNLLKWDDEEFKNFTENELLDLISSHLDIDKSKVLYTWIHFLSYKNGGSMELHKHWHNEDFVLFIYLKTCSSGRTIFYLNDFNEENLIRTPIGILPKKNLAAIFSSTLLHEGEFCNENKQIFVVGIKANVK